MKSGKLIKVIDKELIIALAALVTIGVFALYWFSYSDSAWTLLLAFFMLLLSIPTVILFGKCTYDSQKNAGVLFTVLFMTGIAYTLCFTPFTVPDEPYHYVASYSLANVLTGRHSDANSLEMRKTDAELLSSYSTHLDYENYRTVKVALSQSVSVGKGEAQFEVVDSGINFASGANPVQVKLLSALGIVVGRVIGLSGILTFYLGRIFNLVAYCAAAIFAIRIMPKGKDILLVCSALPMTLHLAASYSYDSGILALTFLLTAFCFRANMATGQITRGEIISITVIAVLLAPCKVIYVFVALLAFHIPEYRFASKKNGLLVKISCSGIVALVLLIQLLSSQQFAAISNAGTGLDVRGTETGVMYCLNDVLKQPLKFCLMLFRTLETNGSFYIQSMIGGSLGWFQSEIAAPWSYVLCWIILLIFSSLPATEDDLQLPFSLKSLMVIIFSAVAICSFASMLFGWTFNTENLIMGVQGRYFLPTLPLLMLGISPKRITTCCDKRSTCFLMILILNSIDLLRVFSIAVCL